MLPQAFLFKTDFYEFLTVGRLMRYNILKDFMTGGDFHETHLLFNRRRISFEKGAL